MVSDTNQSDILSLSNYRQLYIISESLRLMQNIFVYKQLMSLQIIAIDGV